MTSLETARLLLRPLTAPTIEAAMQGDDALASHLGVPVAAQWLEFPEALPYWLASLRAQPDGDAWGSYGFFGRNGQGLVGCGGYKGAPDVAGVVEIGYGLGTDFRGQGLATEAAEALVAHAWTQPEVTSVRAHTLPEASPSTRVLERAGFAFEGPVTDPDDGEVWRWRCARRLAQPPPAR